MKIRIGTRGSELARKQTELVINAISKAYPDCVCETVILRTEGDRILDKPLMEFGGKGVFVTEFEEALQEGKIDLAVHSAKDMPMELAKGLTICGVLPREDVRDVLVTRKDYPLQVEHLLQERKQESGTSDRLEKEREIQAENTDSTGKRMKSGNPQRALKPYHIGTSSLRRQCQIEQLYSNVQCVSIRGNVPTRLRKLRDGEYDGVVLAAAGLRRLNLLQEEELEYHYFDVKDMLPAGGQGIIAIEGREQDEIAECVKKISDSDAWLQLQAEQEVLRLLNAGCHEAVGVATNLTADKIELRIMKEMNGKLIYVDGMAPRSDYSNLAVEQVQQLLQKLKYSNDL
ncbi:MAG: hydroxymethylbilane synthase [Lachnospiraceae bacterium]|nr:hydroxymethylbilane synthase [Lachnospiraceae bacterium]